MHTNLTTGSKAFLALFITLLNLDTNIRGKCAKSLFEKKDTRKSPNVYYRRVLADDYVCPKRVTPLKGKYHGIKGDFKNQKPFLYLQEPESNGPRLL